MNLARKTKAIAASSILSGSLFAAGVANAEPNQTKTFPPDQGFGAQFQGNWGVTDRPLSEIRQDVKSQALNGETPMEILKSTSFTDPMPKGPDDHMQLRLTLRHDFLVAAAAAKLEDGVLRPAEATLGFVVEKSGDEVLMGSVGLLGNIHRTAFSRFQLNGQPLTLLTDKPFNDRMTLSDHGGLRMQARQPVADSESLFFNFDAATTVKITGRNGEAGYSPVPSQVASFSLEKELGEHVSTSLGGSFARLSLPYNRGAEYNATGTAMAGLGSPDTGLTAIAEVTRIMSDNTATTSTHYVAGGMARAGGRWARGWLAGAYAVDTTRAEETPTVKITSGELGFGLGPPLVNAYGTIGGGKATSDNPVQNKWFGAAMAGVRANF